MHRNAIRLGVPRTWEVYLVVAAEVVIAYALVLRLELPSEKVRVLAMGTTIGVLFLVNEFLLSASLLLGDGEICVRRLGYLRRRVCLQFTQVASVSLERKHDPLLRFLLTDGTSMRVGPWTRWKIQRRFQQLVVLKETIEKYCLATGPQPSVDSSHNS